MPNRLSLTRMAALIAGRQLSPAELMEAHLAQVKRLDPSLHAFVSVFAEEARTQAREAERGTHAGPLHGIPITVKDSFDIRGLPTLCGSRLRIGHQAGEDSTVVKRLRSAGAIVLGKTNCPEFLANYETDNAITGWTANPWNRERSAGGSSGGEAAAIASFCSPGGVGSDGGGSVRVPAHFCGIAGLKPTPGRISAAGHYPEIAHPGGLLGVAGPMARSAEDLRLLFSVLAGYDPADPFSAPVPIRDPDLTGVRIGVMEQYGPTPVQASIRDAVRAAAGCLAELGFATEEFDASEFEAAPEVWWFFFTELTASFTRDLVGDRHADAHWTGQELLRMVSEDRHITGKEVVENLSLRDRMRIQLLRRMEGVPVLLTPPCAVSAFRPGERQWQIGDREIGLREAMSPATPFNLFGMPAIVVPFAFSPDGLPVGVQLVARPWEEELLLELACRLERARGPLPAPQV